MATNNFIGFASNGSANVMSQVEYAAAAEQGIGVQPGMASSKLANKIWRQGANMAAALGRIAAARGYDALDNGDLNALQSAIDDTISVGTFNKMFFSQTSGSYIAPRTGVYRITLKSGGGGGGGQGANIYSCGGGGGEGGTLIFYTQLIKDQAYPFVIGAGGSAGADGTTGNAGGATSFNSVYRVNWGFGGGSGDSAYRSGGLGGNPYIVPDGEIVYFIPGACGMSGVLCTDVTDLTLAVGGGAGGGRTGSTPVSGIYGGGGGGGIRNQVATNGGDGYILIEYAG